MKASEKTRQLLLSMISLKNQEEAENYLFLFKKEIVEESKSKTELDGKQERQFTLDMINKFGDKITKQNLLNLINSKYGRSTWLDGSKKIAGKT